MRTRGRVVLDVYTHIQVDTFDLSMIMLTCGNVAHFFDKMCEYSLTV